MNVIFNDDEKRVIAVFNENTNTRISIPDKVRIATIESRTEFVELFGEYDNFLDFVFDFSSWTIKSIKASVNDMVENKRLEFITRGAGQALVYILKQQQLAAFRSNGNMDAELVAPILVSEAIGRDMSVKDLATEWEYNQSLWINVAAQLEGLRQGAFTSLLSAKTDADVNVILEKLELSLAQITLQ